MKKIFIAIACDEECNSWYWRLLRDRSKKGIIDSHYKFVFQYIHKIKTNILIKTLQSWCLSNVDDCCSQTTFITELYLTINSNKSDLCLKSCLKIAYLDWMSVLLLQLWHNCQCSGCMANANRLYLHAC